MIRVWKAARNLVRIVARDPVWVIRWIVRSPWRLLRFMVRLVLWTLGTALLLGLPWRLATQAMGLSRHSGVYLAGMAAIYALVVAVAWQLLSAPLLRHFSNRADDIHGLVRFASRTETDRRAAASGLLIGRDLRSVWLLRHDGPAHLLTLAPARIGKDGGTMSLPDEHSPIEETATGIDTPCCPTCSRSIMWIDP